MDVSSELHCDSTAEEEEEKESDDFNFTPEMDRGWSWVVMIASFCGNILTDGITFCSGLVLSELVVTFHESVSKTAWVSSLQSGISMLAGKVSRVDATKSQICFKFAPQVENLRAE